MGMFKPRNAVIWKIKSKSVFFIFLTSSAFMNVLVETAEKRCLPYMQCTVAIGKNVNMATDGTLMIFFLKVHKREKFFGSDFEPFIFLYLVKLKY